MKNTSLLFVGALLGLCVSTHAQETPQGDAVSQGKALFDARCGICHAKGGIGTSMLGKRLGEEHSLLATRTDIPSALLEHVVRNGINSMPVFTRVELTDAELQLISAYLTRPAQAR
jgi:mono/diheme cytochrome c family protein